LEYLLGICQGYNAEFSILSTMTDILKRYGVMPRYPNELMITREDMKTALIYAKSVQEFVLIILNKSSLETVSKLEVSNILMI